MLFFSSLHGTQIYFPEVLYYLDINLSAYS